MKLNIGTRLIGGFLIVAALVAFAAIMGILKVNTIEHDTDIIALDRLPQTQASLRLQILQKACRVNILELSLVRTRLDQWSHYKENYQQKAEEFDRLCRGILNGDDELGIKPCRKGGMIEQYTREVQSEFADFKAVAEEVIDHKKMLLDQVNAGAITAAEALTDEELKVLVREDFRAASKKVETPIERIDERAETQIDAALEDAYATSSSAKTILLIVLFVSVGVAVIIGVLISRSITEPINHLRDVARTLSTGDVSVAIEIDKKDETGELAESFQEMVALLKTKAEAAAQIAQGNLTVDLKIASKEDTLGAAMITMRDSLKSMQENLQATIEEQTAGNIDARCSPDNFAGAYAEMLKGVNESLDAVLNPILEGIEIMQEYARGDLNREMRKLPGKQIVLTEALNTIRKNLQELIKEGAMLAEATEEGHLQARSDASKFEGGYREIIQGMNNTIENIIKPINEAAESLEEMAQGNLTSKMTGDYKGDHAKIKEALNTTLEALNDILGQVAVAVDQVSTGSQQVSDSSQSLSQGATEQASSLEETTSSITEMASQTQQNAENATQANQLAQSARGSAEEGNQQMQEMLKAMEEINEASGNISKIIKVIDEIAFQTNLLALNAAVEAARTGVHGKGFAVVAEEVRNLAHRSATAAKETTEMIENSIKKVDNGTKIANETAKALGEIVNGAAKVTDLVGEIASASEEQSQAIEQVNQAIGQIDQVTQSNTANAEESASAAEELSSQAVQLKQMLTRFKLKDDGGRMLAISAADIQHQHAQLSAPGRAHIGGELERRGEVQEARKSKSTEVKPDEIIGIDDDDFGRF